MSSLVSGPHREQQAVAGRGSPSPAGLGDGIQARLFIFGFQVLFLELLLIRFLAGHIWNLGYFPNLVLLAAFIGFGLGFLLHDRISEGLSTRLYGLMPMILLAFVLLVLWLKPGMVGLNSIQLDIDGELFFSYPYRGEEFDAFGLQVAKFSFWFSGVVGIFFLIGQKMAKLFRQLRPLKAYSLDISGSLLGIVAFMLISHYQVPAMFWFLVFALSFWLAAGHEVRPLYRIGSTLAASALAAVTLFLDNPSLTDYRFGAHSSVSAARENPQEGIEIFEHSVWSPYQRLTAIEVKGGYGTILANGISHQEYGGREFFLKPPYISAHLLRSDLGEEQFKEVLIIGSGAGNDVIAALQAGAERIDAVEIDPGIARFGYRERGLLQAIPPPYFDPRVSVHLDDGRHWLFSTDRSYDLVVLALTDSLVKVSSVSQLRLENYLFTTNAFRQAVRLLKPGGWFVMYNAYRQEWLAQKLEQMLADSLPPGADVETIKVDESKWAWRVIIGRTPYSPDQPLTDSNPRDYGLEPATDDWPFPYMKARDIPAHYLAAMAAVIGFVAATLLLFARPARRVDPYLSVAFTLMGAAFLLLETKGVIQFSLLFGTTWLNNSLVFFAVLVSVLLAIWVAERVRTPRLLPVAAALIFVSTGVSLAVPLDSLLVFDPWPRFALASALMFTPVFLANLIFSILFRDRQDAELYFGWNLLGATIGGVLEYLSIATGYQALGLVVIILYAGALACAWRGLRSPGRTKAAPRLAPF